MKAAIDAKMTRWEGQYVCTDCDYSTKNSSDLRRHIEAKHVQTAGWECSVCSIASFVRRRMLMKSIFGAIINKDSIVLSEM